MIDSFVITLREGIEAALVLGIILAYLKKTGREALKKNVYYGLIAAVAASVLGAVGMSAAGIDPDNEILEGSMLLIAAIFVGSMVYWMQTTGKNIKADLEGRLAGLVGAKAGDDVSTGAGGFGLAALTFFIVFREGVETVLFLGAASLTNTVSTTATKLLSVTGGLLGIALAVVFAIFLTRGSLRINLGKFFGITSAILVLLTIRLLAGSAHEFAEIGAIPMNPWVMKVLGYIVRENASQIITMALVALPIVMVLLDTGNAGEKAAAVSQAPGTVESAAERRRRLARVQSDRNWRYAVIVASLAVILVLGWSLVASASRPIFDPDPVPAATVSSGAATGQGEIRIAASLMDDGKLHKFSQPAGGVSVRFVAIKKSDGGIGTALDACEICGSAGYFNENENLICKNCNAPIAIDTVGIGGGCNPLTLPSRVEGGDLVIKTADLEKNAGRFTK